MFEIVTKQRPPTPEVKNLDTFEDSSPKNSPNPTKPIKGKIGMQLL